MRKTIIALALIAVVVAGFIITRSPEGDGIRIGFIGNLTGDYAEYTINFREGVELARSLHNSDHSRKVEMIYEDDAFESKRGLLAFQKLVHQDKVVGIINVTTPTIGVIKPEVNKNNIPTVQFGIEPDGSQDDYVFTVYPGGVDTEKKVAEQSTEYLKGCTKPIIIYSQVDAMISQKESFKQGYQVKMEEYVLSDDIEAIRNSALLISSNVVPDCIIMETTPLDGAQFLKSYLLYTKKVPQLFFSAIFYPSLEEYRKVLGTDLAKFAEAIVPVVETYSSDEFKELFREKYGKEPGAYAEFGFDAFHVLVDAHHTDAKEWRKNIQKTELKGVSSYITYDETGSVNPKVKVVRLKEMLQMVK